MTMKYAPEILSNDEDDGTMVDSKDALEAAVVGHRIVKAGKEIVKGQYYDHEAFVLTLDDGTRVQMVGEGDCCAYTELEAFLLHPDRVDHIITGVGTTNEYQTWHIYADFGDVLELSVAWSCGNPFYYGYGFNITVVPA